MTNLVSQLILFQKRLQSKGHIQEAKQIRQLILSHYIPEDSEAPSFWRRNLDYGEGLYHGDMSKKKSVEEFLNKKKKKKKSK